MKWIGIDPGKSGGIGIISDEGDYAIKMPETERDLFEYLSDNKEDAFCLIEKVHAMPGQGVTSMFNFGMSYGGLRMAIVGNGIPFETVTPQKWQKTLGCMTKGDKNVSKRKAQELFPKIKITHAIADSLLIAHYAKYYHNERGQKTLLEMFDAL